MYFDTSQNNTACYTMHNINKPHVGKDGWLRNIVSFSGNIHVPWSTVEPPLICTHVRVNTSQFYSVKGLVLPTLQVISNTEYPMWQWTFMYLLFCCCVSVQWQAQACSNSSLSCVCVNLACKFMHLLEHLLLIYCLTKFGSFCFIISNCYIWWQRRSFFLLWGA